MRNLCDETGIARQDGEMTPPADRPASDRATLLAAYDRQLRGFKEMDNCIAVRALGPMWVGVFPGRGMGFLSYETLGDRSGADLDALVGEAVAYFRDTTDVRFFEWKTRGHDAVVGLTECLRAHGFTPDEEETVMIGSAAELAAIPQSSELPAVLVVRQVGAGADRHADLVRAHDLQAKVFGHPVGGIDELERQLDAHPDSVSFWLAEVDGDIVSAGRINPVMGSDFAGIWGGVTHPQWRGRGIYRALTSARAKWAAERGVVYINSDSTEFSRPILERAGLLAVTTTTPYLWTRP